jgi:hypothetical protein
MGGHVGSRSSANPAALTAAKPKAAPYARAIIAFR